MSKRFDPKKYQGKKRLFQRVAGAAGIQRIWVWDADRGEYRAPTFGQAFVARRYEATAQGGRKRAKAVFGTLEEAREWTRHLASPAPDLVVAPLSATPKQDLGPSFQDVYDAFWKKKVSKLGRGTQANYRRYVRLHFASVMDLPIRAIAPRFVDDLLEEWRGSVGRFHQSKSRTCFKHELSVLRSVLRFYQEYYDDPEFRFPLKERHARDAVLAKAPPKHKDFTEEEFVCFRDALAKRKHGALFSVMATVQFYQALRISEVAALRHEDLRLNFRSPRESSLQVCQHVVYPRVGKEKPVVEDGFKNAQGGQDSVKEQPLWSETFAALKAVYRLGGKGLLFGLTPTEPFPYRTIQAAYDAAFEDTGLPYRGTHVLRHGGTRRVYNATGGDLAVAQQLLGNADLESTLVYAKRDKRALRNLVEKDWQTKEA
jgi:integrase